MLCLRHPDGDSKQIVGQMRILGAHIYHSFLNFLPTCGNLGKSKNGSERAVSPAGPLQGPGPHHLKVLACRSVVECFIAHSRSALELRRPRKLLTAICH